MTPFPLPLEGETKEPDMTTELPTWDEMTDLDKGAALMHAWKRNWEGASYATEHYPARYFDHQVLLVLDTKDACAHAVTVTKGWRRWDFDEVDRLYYLALEADQKRYEANRVSR